MNNDDGGGSVVEQAFDGASVSYASITSATRRRRRCLRDWFFRRRLLSHRETNKAAESRIWPLEKNNEVLKE